MNSISNKQTYAAEGGEIDLSALVGLISENRWLIIFVTALVFSLGLFYSSRQIPQYQSDVLLQIESNKSSMGQTGGMGAFMMPSLGGDATSIQVALIQSRFILEPVIQELGLDIFAYPKTKSWWSKLFLTQKNNIQVDLFEVPKDNKNQLFTLIHDANRQIRVLDADGHLLLQGSIGQLMVSADKRIRLKVSAVQAPIGTQFSIVKKSDPLIVQSLSQTLTIQEIGAGPNIRQNTGILSLSLRGPNPERLVKTLNAIAKITKAKDAQKKSQEAAQTLVFLYHQLPITKGQLEKAETALNAYRAKSGKIDIKLQTQFLLNQLTELDKKLGELQINKIDMLQRYTLEHPLLQALVTQSNALHTQRNKLEQGLKKLPASDQIAVNLMRDVDVKKTLYLKLLSKIQELEVVKAGTVSAVHILSFAHYPESPLRDKKNSIYMASIFFGLMLSALIIAGRRYLSPKVCDPHWSEKHFNLANLAIIPYCKDQTKNALDFEHHHLPHLPLLSHMNPRNLTVESLRSLRTSLQVTLACASNNIISIMGVSPGVGKSFISANLAYLLAAGGKRVLLIDADLRRGTLHKHMNVPAKPGLAEILNQTISVELATIKTLNSNLTFIPRGAYPSNPSELLMSDVFKPLLHSLSQQYDAIVIDTAPVLLVTDAVIIGAISAINYLVMGASSHQPEDIAMVLKRLADSGVQVQGSIYNFNRAETITRSYGQYGKYGKYGRYSYKNAYYYDETMKT